MCDPSGALARSDGATHVSLWVQRWQRHISSWLHLSLSQVSQVVLPSAGRGRPLLLGFLFTIAFPSVVIRSRFAVPYCAAVR